MSLKNLDSNKHLLTNEQKRKLERSIRNCVMNGLNLDEANFQLCREFNNKIQEQQHMFRHVEIYSFLEYKQDHH